MSVINILCLLVLVYGTLGKENPVGSGTLKVHTYKGCKVDTKSDIFKIELKSGKSSNLASGNLTLDFDITKAHTISITVDKWTGSQWKKNDYVVSGILCEFLTQVAENIYKHVQKFIKPGLPKACPIKKGFYQMNNYPAIFDSKDVGVNSVRYGKVRFNIKVIAVPKTIIHCMILEGEIVPN